MATRTRQRSMKEFFAPAAFDPSQSPMKAARRAGRTQSGTSTSNSNTQTQSQPQPSTSDAAQASASTQPNEEMDVGEESEDPILLSPRSKKAKGKGVKRSQSPSTSGDEAEGERKRPKLDKDAARAIFGGTRITPLPSSLPTTAINNGDGNRALSPDRRATSVPPEPQHVDLAKVSSPKRKSTCRERMKARLIWWVVSTPPKLTSDANHSLPGE